MYKIHNWDRYYDLMFTRKNWTSILIGNRSSRPDKMSTRAPYVWLYPYALKHTVYRKRMGWKRLNEYQVRLREP